MYFFFYLELIVSTENIYYGIINRHSVVFLHAFEQLKEKFKIFQLQKNTRPDLVMNFWA